MIALVSGILNRSQNVLPFQVRIVLENLLDAGSSTEQFKDIRDTDPHAANARATTALRIVYRNSAEATLGHGTRLRDQSSAF